MTWQRAGETALAGLCAYEITAIVTRQVPTVSSVCRRRRWVEAALLGAFLVHLHYQGEAK